MTAGLGAVAEGSRMPAWSDRAGRQVDVPAELQAIWYGEGPSRAAASGGAEPRGSDWDSMPGATLRLVAWMLGLTPQELTRCRGGGRPGHFADHDSDRGRVRGLASEAADQ